jgi:hypothetical protein
LNIFGELQQGDSATWDDDSTVMNNVIYTSAGYTLKYELRGPGSPLTLTATAKGSGWTTSLTTTQSAALAAGKWWWSACFSTTGVRVTAGQGEFTVTPDISAAAGMRRNRTQSSRIRACQLHQQQRKN